jgi:hypothetical protein
MNGLWDNLKKVGVFLLITAACALAGLIVPLLFDRDVGGAMASGILGVLGLVAGAVVALFTIRRVFD